MEKSRPNRAVTIATVASVVNAPAQLRARRPASARSALRLEPPAAHNPSDALAKARAATSEGCPSPARDPTSRGPLCGFELRGALGENLGGREALSVVVAARHHLRAGAEGVGQGLAGVDHEPLAPVGDGERRQQPLPV